MTSSITISGKIALVTYVDDLEMFRGEFVELNGGADFYARDLETLRKEGTLSLQIFIDECNRRGLEPERHQPGKHRVDS